jgi:outer membrane protein assembly factor BamB
MSAFSGVNGTNAWSAVQTYTYGPTSAANGVVYVGALDGLLRAYDAATGLLHWAFPLGAPVSSGAAIGAGTLVIGAGTSESDLEFKLCEQLPASLAPTCRQTPLDQTLNPLGDLGEVWAFATN